MLKKLGELRQLVTSNPPKRLALAAAQDHISMSAVLEAQKEGIIVPVLVGNRTKIIEVANEFGYDISNVEIIDVPDPLESVKVAVTLVHDKECDILMKGGIKTMDLLKGVLNKDWGLRTGKLLSHIALFEVDTYHKLIAITDVAMNIAPTLQEKIAIIENSVNYLRKMGIEKPKVAVLGAIEMVDEKMTATLDAALLSKMNQRDQILNCIIDGPLAFDNAVSSMSARYKGITSEVAGDCDLLLVPDIEVGNVLYKSMVFFAKAKVASIILGASAPIVLTSRSDTEEAKFNSILLSAIA